MFITFEGSDGAGKTTVLRGVSKWFDETGQPYTQLRMLDHDGLRQIVLNETFESPVTTVLIMKAMHTESYQRVRRWLQAGYHVLMDRGPDSFTAYQGYAQKQLELVRQIEGTIPGAQRPDLTILLDLPVELAENRLRGRANNDGYDNQARAFRQTVRDAFLEIAQNHPQRVHTLDASLSPDGLLEAAVAVIQAAQSSLINPIYSE